MLIELKEKLILQRRDLEKFVRLLVQDRRYILYERGGMKGVEDI